MYLLHDAVYITVSSWDDDTKAREDENHFPTHLGINPVPVDFMQQSANSPNYTNIK